MKKANRAAEVKISILKESDTPGYYLCLMSDGTTELVHKDEKVVKDYIEEKEKYS